MKKLLLTLFLLTFSLGMSATQRNENIQNETISDNRTYIGKTIKAGRSVTTTKPVGDVIINGANLVIQGGNVELHPGTTIINSNVEINPHANDSGQ